MSLSMGIYTYTEAPSAPTGEGEGGEGVAETTQQIITNLTETLNVMLSAMIQIMVVMIIFSMVMMLMSNMIGFMGSAFSRIGEGVTRRRRR